MEAYLFVHFKEKETPDGEQVYFGISRDGFRWEKVNNGQPILWSEKGEKGVRDHTIVRMKGGKFKIISTDLSLANNLKGKYEDNWGNIMRKGSKYLSSWESNDLIHWSEEQLIELGDQDFGCLWAPDIIYDSNEDDYVLHWSSAHSSDNYKHMAIYYTRTKDFKSYSKPQLLCRKKDSGIIDSAIYEADGLYYRFVKSDRNPAGVILEVGQTLTGEYTRVKAFDEEMNKLGSSHYEAPTMFRLQNQQWCLMIDWFGEVGEGQGYRPFIAEDIHSGKFIYSDENFEFPYRFKHGTVLPITLEEYNRIKEAFPNNQ